MQLANYHEIAVTVCQALLLPNLSTARKPFFAVLISALILSLTLLMLGTPESRVTALTALAFWFILPLINPISWSRLQFPLAILWLYSLLLCFQKGAFSQWPLFSTIGAIVFVLIYLAQQQQSRCQARQPQITALTMAKLYPDPELLQGVKHLALAPANEISHAIVNALGNSSLTISVYDREPRPFPLEVKSYQAIHNHLPDRVIITSPQHYKTITQELIQLGVLPNQINITPFYNACYEI
ncbi:MAG: hypothetical protein HQL49_07745 [Gammaproteobacteria bacterium]|nr:hypothetical protein [Gammaproteobacteria bacterium]